MPTLDPVEQGATYELKGEWLYCRVLILHPIFSEFGHSDNIYIRLTARSRYYLQGLQASLSGPMRYMLNIAGFLKSKPCLEDLLSSVLWEHGL